jgi:tetratricopeptide (TPR) repeat protein
MDELEDKCLLLPFNCGISSRSSLVESMLRYFISIICQKLAIEDDSDDITKFQELKERFMELLFIASEKMRVVAVIDALDQLASTDEARRMLWLTGKLPNNFRLLCSIIDGPELEVFRQLGGEVRKLPVITAEDEAAIIRGIAARDHKEIGREIVDYIIQKKTKDGTQAAQNPLYLSLITQDLVMMDRYELETVQQYMESGMSQPAALGKFMRERIDETPGDPDGAYLAVLARLEKLIDADFVRGVCGMIAVSRGGLRESDMEAAFRALGKTFNPADFSWLRQMMRGHFSLGDMQQWDVSHQSLSRALKKDRSEELKELNEGIAVHFRATVETDPFSVREILHHLCVANKPEIAVEILALDYDDDDHTDYRDVLARGLADMYTEHEEGAAFLLAIPANAEHVEDEEQWRIASMIEQSLPLLPENTRPFRIELLSAALEPIEFQDDIPSMRMMADGKSTIADLYIEMGDVDNAMPCQEKSFQLRSRIWKEAPSIRSGTDLGRSCTDLAHLITKMGRGNEAGELFRNGLMLYTMIYEQSGSAATRWNMAMACNDFGESLMMCGQAEEAGENFRKALEIREQEYQEEGTIEALNALAECYNNMRAYLAVQGSMEEVGEYIRKALEAYTKVYNATGTSATLRNLTSCYGYMGRYLKELGSMEEAGKYFKKALDADTQIYEKSDTVDALFNLSVDYSNMGHYLTDLDRVEEAGEYFRKAYDADSELHEKDYASDKITQKYAESCFDMGKYFTSLEELDEAGYYFKQALLLRELQCKNADMDDVFKDVWESVRANDKWRDGRPTDETNSTAKTKNLWELIRAYDILGDNRHALGLHDEAHTKRVKALELFEQYVELIPSAAEHDSYYRDKASI